MFIKDFSMFLGLATGFVSAFILGRRVRCQPIKYAKPGYQFWGKKVLKFYTNMLILLH